MDYNKNDFQNQNHHLAGEGNNKVPPVLNLYALPKFDSDDSIQGNLRFDSLVETEVFLGIESNEDNRWIEDFPRGSCGIDFSKSAADSCSISRCNNVWSEATSSESVEMLLKSVGPEETIPRQNIDEVSDAFSELDCLTKRMEPIRHDAVFSKIGDVGDLQPAFSLEEVPEDSPGMKNDVWTNQPHAEVSLQTDHGEAVENNSSNLGPDPGAKLGLSAGGYLFDCETCIDVSGRDVSDLVIRSLKNDAEDVTCSEVKVDDALRNNDNIIVEDRLNRKEGQDPTNDASVKDENDVKKNNSLLSEELLGLENKNKMNNESSDGDKQNMFSGEINKQNLNSDAVENMASNLEGAAYLDSNVETTREENPGRTVVSTVTETLVLEGDTDSVTVQESVVEAYGETTIQTWKYQDIPLIDARVTDQSNENVHTESSILLEADEEIVGHPVEAVRSEQGIDSCLQSDHVAEKYNSVDDQLVGGEFDGNCGASLYSVEEKVGEGNADRGRTCNSVQVPVDIVAADNAESSKVEVLAEDSNVEDQGLSSSQAGNTETEEMNGQGDAPNPDSASVCQEESTVLLPNSSGKNGMVGVPAIIDEGLGVLSVSESDNNEVVTADKKEVNTSAEVVLQSAPLDIENDAEVEPSGEDLPTQLSDSCVAVERGSLSEPAECACCASNEQSLDVAVPECTCTLKTGDPESLSQSAEIRVSHDKMEMVVNPVDLTSKGDSCVEVTIAPEKSGVSTLQEKCEMESKVSGDASKALESTLVSAHPLPEGLHISEAPRDGRDHCDSDQTNSETHVARGNGNFSASEKEKEEFAIFTVQDIGMSGAEEQPGRDGPHVPGQKDIDASKAEKSSTTKIVEASPSKPGLAHMGPQVQRRGKRGSPQVPDKESRSCKGTPDRKPSRASIKSAGRENEKKGNFVKDACPVKQSELPGKSSNVSLGPSGIYQLVQPNEILHHGQMDGPGTKPFGALTTPPSTLPDLNSSAFHPMAFQQPFNDMQQVQLRAQILLYGSLISRLVPEELLMVSAFGGPDGGRSMWEKVWQTCKTRVSGQTPRPVNLETPTLPQSANMASDTASKVTKVTPPPTGIANTSGTPKPSINPMIPLSSSLWSLPTPSVEVLQSSGLPRGAVVDYQPAYPQLAPHQTQPVISYVGHSTAWMSHTPFHGPWAASLQTPALNTSIPFPSLPTESVQLTAVRGSSLALSSGMKPAPPGPSAQSKVHPGATMGAYPSLDLAKAIVESGQPSSDLKSKKRKKGPTPEDRSRISLQSQSRSEKLSVPAAISSLSASITATSPAGFLSKCNTLDFTAVVSPTPSTAPIKADQGKKKPVLSEDAIDKVKEARQQAEDAAALAAAAVSHSQEVWNDLDKKKMSGSISVSEAKLASATVAVAAAAAIAKAAAAAANVASNAALQAKAMADETLAAGDCSNPNISDGNPRGVGGINSSSSIISAAKEAAKIRVEAASAAALRAENLDIIVKAAELAAEAISQAGKVVTMDNPLSLVKLAEAGPEGFWKLPEFSSEQASKVHDANIELANNDNLIAKSIGSKERSDGPQNNGAGHSSQIVPSPAFEEILGNPVDDQVRLIVGISGTASPVNKDGIGQKLPTISNTANTTGVNPESQYGLRPQDIGEWRDTKKAAGAEKDYGIQEGSCVEVFKVGNGHKGSWFSADVMSLKDGKAYVCYNDLPSITGSGKLQEWVDLEGAGDRAPKIRIRHPMTAVQFDGSKKRRRAAIGSFTCSAGDKVDAWIQDSWWEGVVTEKSKKDGTFVTVQLPVLGETLVVRAWHLRPSLVWKGGEWIEWSSTGEDNLPHHEGDTPKEKRPKLGSSGSQAKGKDKTSKTVKVPDSGKPEGSKLLDLSAKEKIFNIGKSNMDEDRPDSHRTVRSGLRKQGPGVIFGVPKPGKKRKFMEVSKHYVEDQSNNKAEVNERVKIASYLMPRGTGSHGLRNARKTDVKENEAAESKANVLATVRSQGFSDRMASRKYSSKISVSTSSDTSVTDHVGKMKDSSGHVVKHNLVGAGSFSSSEAAIGDPILFFSRASSPDANISKLSAPKSDSVNKDKPTSTGGKLAKIKEDKILSSDSQVEPRRSNRRIQPTSRLLEGLQSLSIISKVPSSSHDKGHRSIRSGAEGNDSDRELVTDEALWLG